MFLAEKQSLVNVHFRAVKKETKETQSTRISIPVLIRFFQHKDVFHRFTKHPRYLKTQYRGWNVFVTFYCYDGLAGDPCPRGKVCLSHPDNCSLHSYTILHCYASLTYKANT